MITLDQIQLIHMSAAEGDLIGAANLAFAADGEDVRVDTRDEAIKTLQALEKNLADENRYIEVAALLWGNKMFDSRPSVVRQVFEAVIKNHKLIILGASSLSKCLGPDVGVRMFDGSVKLAKEVVTGDILMGDDNKPRNVLAAHSGHGELFEIQPHRGKSWICNGDHILSLRQGTMRLTHGRPSAKWVKGKVYDIPIKEYMGYSRFRKLCLNQYHVPIEYKEKPTQYDPYIYGAWLGDGSSKTGYLASPRCDLTRKWRDYFESIGMYCTEYKHKTAKCSSWVITGYRLNGTDRSKRNKWTAFVRSSLNEKGKYILPEYMINSRAIRLSVLAGLIDTDGCVIDKGTAYLIGVTPSQLANQIYELVRSLGFGGNIYRKPPTKSSKNWSHAVTVTGIGIEEIPTIDRKLSVKSKRMTSNVGIKEIKSIGEGRYCGFLIDGNHRFLLSDYTVTHNTYSCGVLYYLFWRNDRYWTAVKLAGPSEDHLYGNLFSHIVALHKASVIPLTENDSKLIDINETDMFISMHDALPEMRIQCVLCKQNQISATGLRGHKPKPYRTTMHPKLGKMTRVYILIDEGTHVSPGAFEDIKTTEASINPDTDTVKIVMACNPEGIGYRIVQLAEPEGGWDVDQVDTLYNWVSAKGYPVLRLDGKRFENVVQRKIIYEGMMSYETFLDFLKSGEHSGPYWAKGRGFPPLKDNAWTIIPPSWPSSQRGEPIYVGKISHILAHDTALGGSDKALCGLGRWGEAAGWTDYKGEVTWFYNRASPDQKVNRHVMVMDQIFQLPKSDNTVEIVQEIMGRAKELGIPPENVVMDMGGNAGGVWSHASKFWGNVLGVDSGQRATEEKILSDDRMTAYDSYLLMVSQLWFTMKRWLDPVVCAVLINPNVPSSPLFSQLTTRRYRNVKGGKVQVEPKHEYRARNQGVSPDEADILNLLVAWCHQRGGVTPGIMESKDDTPSDGERVSLKNADEPDTLRTDWAPARLEANDEE